MNEPFAKTKIYQGIVCVELRTPEGPQWWYQGAALAFSPVKVASIRRIVRGLVGRKQVWAVPFDDGRTQALAAINLPRSDLWALKAQGLLPADFPLPSPTPPAYTPWPAAARANPGSIL